MMGSSVPFADAVSRSDAHWRREMEAFKQTQWLRSAVLATPIVGVVLLSKLTVPPWGEQGLGLALPVLALALLLGAVGNQFRIAPNRLAMFLLVLAAMGLMQIFKTDLFSSSSLLLLTVLHFPYVLYVRGAREDQARVIDFFLKISTLCAWCAVAQFFLQFVIDAKYLFPFETFVPDQFLVKNFNFQAPLSYGSNVYRANGVFLLEPSYLSQLLAVALVTELCTRSRWRSLLLYGLAILVSFSGTGLMVLAVCLPVVVIARKRWALILWTLLLVGIVAAFSQDLYVDLLLARITEFNSTGSSGFARFVGGFYLFDQYLWNDPLRALFGFGAGTFKEYAPLANYPVAEMPIFKMVFEFGLVGALLYFAFLLYCLFSSSVPSIIALAIGMTFLLNGLYVPFSHAIALSMLIWTSGGAISVPVLRRAHVEPDPPSSLSTHSPKGNQDLMRHRRRL